jgi:septal ring factor EnvC (AmiA/AmiB activator)
MDGTAQALLLALGLALLLGLPGAALAQSLDPSLSLRPSQSADSPPPDAATLRARDQELEAIRAQQKESAESEARLRREIETIGTDRTQLTRQLIETAARIRDGETRLGAVQARLQPLDQSERAIHESLDSRQSVIADVLAALQRIGRRPPPALLVGPEDALRSVRTAILLGAVVPELRVETEALASDLAELVRVRKDIAEERDRLGQEVASLTGQQQKVNLLVEERQHRQAETEKALQSERDRAAQLARQVDNLKDLIAKLEGNLDSAARASRSAARANDDNLGVDTRQSLAALKDPGRLSPAIAFSAARGMLPLPVNGIKIRDFGHADRLGGVEKGSSIATRTGAQVTAPCDGWVVYAGPFRSYGQLLILNAGGGYHVLLAGMERISVDLGQFVLTGEPVAIMGNGGQLAGLQVTGSSQPILYVEFRKDGAPIDPSPWWANEGEKVRG